MPRLEHALLIFKMLVTADGDVNAENAQRLTVLMIASAASTSDVLGTLLEKAGKPAKLAKQVRQGHLAVANVLHFTARQNSAVNAVVLLLHTECRALESARANAADPSSTSLGSPRARGCLGTMNALTAAVVPD